MADMGWGWNPERDRWELRGQDGWLLGMITARFADAVGWEGVRVIADRRGWPSLPGPGTMVCVLWGGPLDGQWEYLADGAVPSELLMGVPAEGAEGAAVLTAPARYRLERPGRGKAPHKYRWVP